MPVVRARALEPAQRRTVIDVLVDDHQPRAGKHANGEFGHRPSTVARRLPPELVVVAVEQTGVALRGSGSHAESKVHSALAPFGLLGQSEKREF